LRGTRGARHSASCLDLVDRCSARAWGEYAIYHSVLAGRRSLGWAEFSILWGGVASLVLVPAATGAILGGLYASRSERVGWPVIRRWLTAGQEAKMLGFALGRTPAPRAWDHFFSERPNTYLRVRVRSGTWIAGRFAAASYAGGFPNDTDLYLEEAWEIDQESGELGDRGLGFPVYVPADTIEWLDVIAEQTNGEEADHE
jgi:hypothetical protein